jgi:hypothetical protein
MILITPYPGRPYGEIIDTAEAPDQVRHLWDRVGHGRLRNDLVLQLREEMGQIDGAVSGRTAHA